MNFVMDNGILQGYSGNSFGMIEIPEETIYIGTNAFSESDIKEIDLSTAWSLSTIMSNAFYGCYRLKKVIMNRYINQIEYAAFACCSALEEIELPEDIEVISSETFLNCYKLNNVTIPYGVKRIERSAFSSCGLTSIEIPSSVEEIEEDAFYGCPIETAHIPKELNIDIEAVYNMAGPDRGREKVKIIRT